MISLALKTVLPALVLMMCGAALAFQNEPTGFRGIAWGTPFSAVSSQMTPVPGGTKGILYLRKGDAMKLGGARLDSVVYEFYRGVFSAVMLVSSNDPDARVAINAAFTAQFGHGVLPDDLSDDRLWQGAVGGVFLTCSPINESCTALIRSTKAVAQRHADEAAAAARAKKDF